MTLLFSDGAYNHAAGTRDAFGALSDELVAEGHPPMTSRSGDREPDDQLKIWYERMTLTPGGRKVYGRKTWQGRTWYQIHPEAVGVPGTSNHEKRRSNDLRAPYNADTAAARRAKELARKHNITREGEGFRELWHWTFWGPLGTIGAPAPAGGANTAPVPEEDETMEAYVAVPSGAVVHLFPGGRHVFGSKQEYEAYRGDVNFIRARGGLDMADVPDLSQIVNVNWATFERMRDNFGVPDDSAFQGGTIDVEQLAKDLAARMGYDVASIRAAVRAELATLTLKAG